VHADLAPLEDATSSPPEDDMEDEYNENAVNVSFNYVAFTSSASTIDDMSDYMVVDTACSVNLTTYRSNFSDFHPSSRLSTVGGVVGVSLMRSGIV
jgi:hypothetical protein